MKFKLTLLAISLVVIGAGFWLTAKIEQTASQKFRISSDKLPDYYMNNFTVHGTDIAGLAKFRLTAIKMKHYPYDDHSDLVKPQMLFYTPEGPAWQVASETGRIVGKNQRIVLFGQVAIIRPKSDTTPKVTIVTRDLHFEPIINYLSTDNHIKYTSGLSQIEGTGLRASLKNGFIRILNNVKAHYAPAKK